MKQDDLKHYIGLTLIPGIGNIFARKILANFNSPEEIFKESRSNLMKIPRIGQVLAEYVSSKEIAKQAEEEVKFIADNNIHVKLYTDDSFPKRLKLCNDAPLLLYHKGDCDFQYPKIISIVGTRNATSYGKEICEKLISELAESDHNPIIVSGLAYGIDTFAHKFAIQYGLQTISVLGHGLNQIYPPMNSDLAADVEMHGALLTDFTSNSKFDRNNFIKRNRIIAGISDATLVIESGEKGGSLVTADLANSYNREVFAIPGNLNNKYSQGCNNLIKQHKAVLTTSYKDIEYYLNWDTKTTKTKKQKKLFVDISQQEEELLILLQENNKLNLDELMRVTKFPMNKLSSLLLELEFKGLVKTHPGKAYSLN